MCLGLCRELKICTALCLTSSFGGEVSPIPMFSVPPRGLPSAQLPGQADPEQQQLCGELGNNTLCLTLASSSIYRTDTQIAGLSPAQTTAIIHLNKVSTSFLFHEKEFFCKLAFHGAHNSRDPHAGILLVIQQPETTKDRSVGEMES